MFLRQSSVLQNIGDINDFHVYVPNIDEDIGE